MVYADSLLVNSLPADNLQVYSLLTDCGLIFNQVSAISSSLSLPADSLLVNGLPASGLPANSLLVKSTG